MEMSQLYITAWLTMNTKTLFGVWNDIFGVRELSYDVSEGHIATIIIKQWPLEGKIQNGRHCNVMCLSFASK